MKTIAELNDKWWYRLLKVIYVVTFIAITYGVIDAYVLSNSELAPHPDIEKSYIECSGGGVHSLSEIDIREGDTFLFVDNVLTSIKDDEKASQLCTIQMTASEYEERYDTPPPAGIDFGKYGRPLGVNYELVVGYTDKKWGSIIGYSLCLLVIALFISEVIRRTFYYVVLGTLKPSLGEDVKDSRFKDFAKFILTKGVWFIEAVVILMVTTYGLNIVFHFIFGIMIFKGNIQSPAILELLKDVSNAIPFIVGIMASVSFYRSKKSKNQASSL